jgi:hypothetical protein
MYRNLLVIILVSFVYSCSSIEDSNDLSSKENSFLSIEQTPLSEDVKVKIQAYLTLYYPNNSVIEVEIEHQYIEVELNNHVELAFNLTGDFLNVDD